MRQTVFTSRTGRRTNRASALSYFPPAIRTLQLETDPGVMAFVLMNYAVGTFLRLSP